MNPQTKFLADHILVQDRIVTYRTLSRAVKIHVNKAKEILFEFHKYQNARQHDSVHATYAVFGTLISDVLGDGEDMEISENIESSALNAFSDPVATQTLSLVAEENMKECLSRYKEVVSVYIYSLGPHVLKDLHMLSDPAQELVGKSGAGDLRSHGTLLNSGVRRRGRASKGASLAAPPAQEIDVKPKPTAAKPAPVMTLSKPSIQDTEPKAAPKTGDAGKLPSAPPLKRGGSGIMQAFSKAAAKAKEPKQSTPAPAALSDDGEDDSDDVIQSKKKSNQTANRKSRQEREAELKRMMEDSEDEEMEDKPETPEDSMEEEPPQEAPQAKEDEGPSEIVSSAKGGRRRGKRRVMRKKQIMDEEGFLVTIQEPAWESFSEDEPVASAPVPKQKPASSSSTQAGKQKKGAAKGQGNIMSFFGKKT